MKLKVRFEKQDMQKFGLYALLLFVVVVLIMSALRTIGTESGMNPFSFSALEPASLSVSLIFYVY